MVITFTHVKFCHQQQYSERTYLFCHQRQYSERTYDNFPITVISPRTADDDLTWKHDFK
jgi:hypothetical protein